MLDEDELVRLAKSRRIRPWQEEKRYLQALVLYSLSQAPPVFKGGTYLWFFHGLNRFSEDLDFTATGIVNKTLSESVSNTLLLFGVSNEARVMKDDKFILSFRISARGPLYRSEKDLSRIYVEISRREKTKLTSSVAKLDEAYYGIPIVFLKGMDLKEIASEKIRAIMTRAAARDLYDLWHVVVRLHINPDLKLIEEKMSFYGKAYDPEELNIRIDSLRDSWEKELRPLVPGRLPEYTEVRQEIREALASVGEREGED